MHLSHWIRFVPLFAHLPCKSELLERAAFFFGSQNQRAEHQTIVDCGYSQSPVIRLAVKCAAKTFPHLCDQNTSAGSMWSMCTNSVAVAVDEVNVRNLTYCQMVKCSNSTSTDGCIPLFANYFKYHFMVGAIIGSSGNNDFGYFSRCKENFHN